MSHITDAIAAIAAATLILAPTAHADPGTLPRVPALIDNGDDCGPWVSPNIGNPLGVLVGEAVHEAMCNAAQNQPHTPPASEPDPPTAGTGQETPR